MKINIYCNDYFITYNQKQKTEIKNLRTGYIKGVSNKEDYFILKGEPTLHYDFNAILDSFDKNYILTTHGNSYEKIIEYPGTIPYISFHWDGFNNDLIKGHDRLTLNIMECLQFLQSKPTVTRIAYTISPHNIKWLSADLVIMKKMMEQYPNMKQPYFMLYQEGEYYNQKNFVWTNITKEQIDLINKTGLLTENNKNYLFAWLKHQDYPCISPQKNITVLPDATVRMCQSYRMKEIIGDLNNNNLSEIISSTIEKRKEMQNCEYKYTCWFACHYKENIYEETRRVDNE